MNNPVNIFSRASILPCIVLSLSLLSLCVQPLTLNTPGVYITALGFLAITFYFTDVRFYSPLVIIWALAQLVVVKHSSSTAGCFNAGMFTMADVCDATQGIRMIFYLPVKLGNAGLVPGINVFAVILMALIWLAKTPVSIGACLQFAAYRHDNSLGIVFPVKGRVERFVTLSGEKDWLLVNLLTPFNYNSKTIWHVLVKRNDKQPLVRNQANQLVFFKPVEDVNKVADKNNKLDFEDEVWALCK